MKANIFLPLPPTFYPPSVDAGRSAGTEETQTAALWAGIDKGSPSREACGRRERRSTGGANEWPRGVKGFVFECKGVQRH